MYNFQKANEDSACPSSYFGLCSVGFENSLGAGFGICFSQFCLGKSMNAAYDPNLEIFYRGRSQHFEFSLHGDSS